MLEDSDFDQESSYVHRFISVTKDALWASFIKSNIHVRDDNCINQVP